MRKTKPRRVKAPAQVAQQVEGRPTRPSGGQPLPPPQQGCCPPQPGSRALSIGGVAATSGKTVGCIVTHSRAEPQTIQPTTSPQRAVSRGTRTAPWLPEAPPGAGRSAAGNGAAGQAGRSPGGTHGPERPHGEGCTGENHQPEGKRGERRREGGRGQTSQCGFGGTVPLTGSLPLAQERP